MRLRIIPREERFFDLFVEDAANVLGAARMLEAMLRSYDDVPRGTPSCATPSIAATRSATTSATASRAPSSPRSTARTSTT